MNASHWLASLGGDSFGVGDRGNSLAAESAAWVMLGVIFLVIGAVGWFCWTLGRRSRKPDETLEFLEKLDDEQKRPPAPETKPPDAAWEKPADWWKKE